MRFSAAMLVFFTGCANAPPAEPSNSTPAEPETGVIRLTVEQQAMCATDACVVVGKDKMNEFVRNAQTAAWDAGRRYERETCASKL